MRSGIGSLQESDHNREQLMEVSDGAWMVMEPGGVARLDVDGVVLEHSMMMGCKPCMVSGP